MIDVRREIEPVLLEIMKLAREAIIKEKNEQGHRLTGASDEMPIEIEATPEGLRGTLKVKYYLLILENGVKPGRVPFTSHQRTRARVSKYIQGLISFFQKRGLRDREAKNAAFATATVQSREGMPTRGSYRYSDNGRRKGFIRRAVENEQSKLTAILERKAGEIISIKLTQTAQGILREFRA